MPFKYKVQLQNRRGEIEEVDYVVQWEPTKVSSEEVARACAAQATVASGASQDEYKNPVVGLSAILVT